MTTKVALIGPRAWSSESNQSQIASSPLIVNRSRIQYGLSVTPSSSMQSWAS